MKKLIFIIFAFTSINSTFSQFNTEIIDTEKLWSTLGSFDPLPGPSYKITYYHKFIGDTVINQIDYNKVWKSVDENHLYWNNIGFIRSDDNSDIFFRNHMGVEGLMYKFDVIQGDTFTINNTYLYGWTFTVEVIEIDSVLVSPLGQYLKRIKLKDADEPFSFEEYWIEGIGSLAGILYSGFHVHPLTGGASYNLLCQWKNDTLTYSNPGYPYCFNTTVSVSELPEEIPILSVYPVPLTSQSYISLNPNNINNGILEIRDIFGNLLKKVSIAQNNKILIDRRNFKPGIYIITLFDGEKLISRKKLLVI